MRKNGDNYFLKEPHRPTFKQRGRPWFSSWFPSESKIEWPPLIGFMFSSTMKKIDFGVFSGTNWLNGRRWNHHFSSWMKLKIPSHGGTLLLPNMSLRFVCLIEKMKTLRVMHLGPTGLECRTHDPSRHLDGWHEIVYYLFRCVNSKVNFYAC